MKISKLHIENIMGIKTLDIEPGSVTEITSDNGLGKTSILAAIKSVFEPGHDATLLRQGETVGETVIVLDDGMTLSKTITADASDRAVKQGKETVKKPATVIAGLTDLLSVNPVAFLQADKKDRARTFLETLPFEADVPRLAKIMTDAGVTTAIGSGGRHALVVIDAARQAIYDARNGVNRAITEKKGTITQLEATLPPPSEAVVGDATELMQQATKLDAERDGEIKRVDDKVASIVGEAEARIQTIRNNSEVELAELRQKLAAATERRDADIAAEQALIQKIKAKQSEQNAATRARCAEQRSAITAQIATIQETAKAAARHAVTKETIGKMQDALGALEAESEGCTKAIEDVDAYKLEILSNLPIPGLTVQDGDLYRDGVVFDRLNEAQRVSIAIDLAKLRAGKLGVSCVDGLECMSTRTYDEFKKQAAASGIQFFVTKVSDFDLKISTTAIDAEVL